MSEGWNRVRGRSPPRANFRTVRPRAASREEPEIVMKNPDAFERILASLYDAMLDDTRWPATSALIDEACGITGNGLMVGEGPKNDVRGLFVGLYYRGSAAKIWSASTSNTTMPSTNGSRASGNCRPVAWCTSTTCTRPRS